MTPRSGESCALCGAAEKRCLFTMSGGFRVEECAACGLAATAPSLAEPEIVNQPIPRFALWGFDGGDAKR